MGYGDCYNSARNRYNNACSEINSCERRLCDLKNQRKQKIDQINQLKTDIKNTQKALDGVTKILKSDDALNRKVTAISSKTGQASVNYCGMVISSDVKGKDLTEVYSNETSKTKSTLNNVLTTLKTKKNELNNRLDDLKNQLDRANTDLQNIENQIRSTESSLQSWKNSKRSAANDMEYYRHKMHEEEAG